MEPGDHSGHMGRKVCSRCKGEGGYEVPAIEDERGAWPMVWEDCPDCAEEQEGE